MTPLDPAAVREAVERLSGMVDVLRIVLSKAAEDGRIVPAQDVLERIEEDMLVLCKLTDATH